MRKNDKTIYTINMQTNGRASPLQQPASKALPPSGWQQLHFNFEVLNSKDETKKWKTRERRQ